MEKPKFSKVHLSFLCIGTAHGYNRNTRLRAKIWIVTFHWVKTALICSTLNIISYQIHLLSFCNVMFYSETHLILQVCCDLSYTLCIRNVSWRRDTFYINCLLATEYIDSVLELGTNRNKRWTKVNRRDNVGQRVMAPHDGGRGRETVLNNHKWKRTNTLEKRQKINTYMTMLSTTDWRLKNYRISNPVLE